MSAHQFLVRAAAGTLLAIQVAACGGSAATPATAGAPAAGTARPAATAATAAPAAATPAAPTAGQGSSDVAATCTDLKTLANMDYAIGKKFSMMRDLADSSRQRTLEDVQAFAAGAPPEIAAAARDLVAVWTALAADPASITETDPRWQNANTTLTAWMAANCP